MVSAPVSMLYTGLRVVSIVSSPAATSHNRFGVVATTAQTPVSVPVAATSCSVLGVAGMVSASDTMLADLQGVVVVVAVVELLLAM